MKSVVAFTSAPTEHALVVLRIAGPLTKAGFRLIYGMQDGVIYPERVSAADIVLIQRDFPTHQEAYEKILKLAHQESKPVVLDLDDWLLELPENHPDRISHHYAQGLFPILRAAVDADAVTVSTERLAEQVRPLNDRVFVLPNYVDTAIWDLDRSHPPGNPLKLVYMGGSSHIPDFDPLIPVLREILGKRAGRLSLHVVGMEPTPELSGLPNLACTPFIMEYAQYSRFAARQQFDMAIAPLEENAFNRCKSSIKYLEYSALGLPAVYSRITPYSCVIHEGENGLLASTPQEWAGAIERLLEDSDLRRRVGHAARETVRKHWLLSDHAHEWAEAYQWIIENPRSQERQQRTIPAGLVIELARQTQAWQESLLRREVEKGSQVQEALPEGVGHLERASSSSLTSFLGGLAGRVSRGVQWLFTQTNKKAG